MQSAHEIVQDLVIRWNTNPALLIPTYKDICPGIPDDEALKLAQSFAALFIPAGRTAQERDAQFKEYRAAVEAAQRKYPGGKNRPTNRPTQGDAEADAAELDAWTI